MKNLGKICFLPAVALMFATTSCKKEVNAGFTADKAEVAVGEPVSFKDNEEIRKNATFNYDFGDGTSAWERNPSHIYWMPGTYTVYQTVTRNGNAEEGKGRTESAMTTITVTGATAAFTAPASVGVDEGFVLTNTTTGTDKGAPVTYQWSYTSTNGMSDAWFSNEKSPAMSFSEPGVYTVTLKAMQGGQHVSTSSMDITVGGTAGNNNAALAESLRGTYTYTSLSNTTSGSTNNAGCPQNGTVTDTDDYTKIILKENGQLTYFMPTGNQTVGNSGSWSLSNDGTLITLSPFGTYALTFNGTTLTGYTKEVQGFWGSCATNNGQLTFEETLTLTKQ